MQNKFSFTFFLGLLLLVFCSSNTSAQKPEVCNTKSLQKPKFNIVSESIGKSVVILITLKPKYQTDENLVLLAKYLKQKYCAENTIIAQIFDNKKDAFEFSVYEVKQIPDTQRAIYYLERDNGKERIARIRVIDNKQVETLIDL